MTNPGIPRREFLRRIGAAAAAGGGIAGAALWAASRPERTVGSAPPLPSFGRGTDAAAGVADRPLAIARGSDVREMVRAAIAEIGGIDRFVGKGDRVVVKPNVAFDRHPAIGATTSPAVVAEVVRCCLEAGAREVAVTDNPINSPDACFRRSGVGEAVVAAGGRIEWPTPAAFGPADLGGRILRDWPVFRRPLDRADVLIGIPTAKVHNLSAVSLTMKNWYGFLGGGRNRLHQQIHGAIRDLAAAFQPTFVVLDATRLLIRHGPTGGSPADVRPGPGIAAATDPVALDALGAEWLDVDPSEVGAITLAATDGIGAADWRALSVREVDVP